MIDGWLEIMADLSSLIVVAIFAVICGFVNGVLVFHGSLMAGTISGLAVFVLTPFAMQIGEWAAR